MPKRVSVTKESSTERNQKFHDNYNNKNMNIQELVKKIKNGSYKNYHVRKINGLETPVSNPDRSTSNNLG